MEVCWAKSTIAENDSSCSADPHPRSGQLQTANIDKLKDRILISCKVS